MPPRHFSSKHGFGDDVLTMNTATVLLRLLDSFVAQFCTVDEQERDTLRQLVMGSISATDACAAVMSALINSSEPGAAEATAADAVSNVDDLSAKLRDADECSSPAMVRFLIGALVEIVEKMCDVSATNSPQRSALISSRMASRQPSFALRNQSPSAPLFLGPSHAAPLQSPRPSSFTHAGLDDVQTLWRSPSACDENAMQQSSEDPPVLRSTLLGADRSDAFLAAQKNALGRRPSMSTIPSSVTATEDDALLPQRHSSDGSALPMIMPSPSRRLPGSLSASPPRTRLTVERLLGVSAHRSGLPVYVAKKGIVTVAVKLVARPVGMLDVCSESVNPEVPVSAEEGLRLSRRRHLEGEVMAMKECKHRNIVPLLEVLDDVANDRLVVVQEYFPLGPVLPPGATIAPVCSVEFVARVAFDISNGLQYLHRRGLIHGNVKPENIFVDVDGCAKLSDAGIIVDLLSPVTTSNTTSPYWAPELSDGSGSESMSRSSAAVALDGGSVQADWAAVDAYALGVVLHLLLWGHLPNTALLAPPALAPLPADVAATDVSIAVITPTPPSRALSTTPSPRLTTVVVATAQSRVTRFEDAVTALLSRQPSRRGTLAHLTQLGAAVLQLDDDAGSCASSGLKCERSSAMKRIPALPCLQCNGRCAIPCVDGVLQTEE